MKLFLLAGGLLVLPLATALYGDENKSVIVEAQCTDRFSWDWMPEIYQCAHDKVIGYVKYECPEERQKVILSEVEYSNCEASPGFWCIVARVEIACEQFEE